MASKKSEYDVELAHARKLARELVDLLNVWILARENTVKTLRDIADDLDTTHGNVNIAKVTGTSVAILGGIAGLAGIVASGGLATPLIVGGIGAAVAGTATTTGADIVDQKISANKLTEAQKCLDADKALVEKVEAKKLDLDLKTEELSRRMNIPQEQLFGALLMAALPFGGVGDLHMQSIFLTTAAFGGACLYVSVMSQMGKGAANIGKNMAASLAEISIKGLTRTVGNIFVAVTGALILWDVVKLVKLSVEINNGSVTEASKNLRTLATKLEEQTKEMIKRLEEVRQKNKDFENEIRDKFRRLLESISEQGHATHEQQKEVCSYIDMYRRSEWFQYYKQHATDTLLFVFHLSRIFHKFRRLIEEHSKKKKSKDIVITVIGHGEINTNCMLPSQLYYMTEALTSITLYQPWGCAIDASVVFGIATNTTRIQNVEYTGIVLPSIPSDWNILPKQSVPNTPQSNVPSIPSDWNILPKNSVPNTPQDNYLIPTPTFSPLTLTEGAYKDLEEIRQALQLESDGLVIEYFNVEDGILPLPTVPLWVITNVIALCASILNIKIKFRYAACLSVDANSERNGHVICSQYPTVEARNPAVCMSDNYISKLANFGKFKRLNKFL